MPRHFPDLIDAYLEFTKGHEGTPKIHLWSFISILAASMERRIWLERGYYKLYPNLYVFIIGRSGLIKKSTSMSIAVNLLREVPGITVMAERLSAAALITQMSEAEKSFEWKSQRIRHAPVFAYASELAVFLQEVFGSILELLTTFYDSTDPNKPWEYKTKKDGAVQIHGPCLNLLAGSTQAWLEKCLPSSEMEGGFTSRVIFVVENKGPQKFVAWPEVDSTMHEHRGKIIEDLKEIATMTGPIQVSDSARDHFTRWYQHHMTEVLPLNLDPRIAGYMGRKGDTLLKLAMVRCVATGDDQILRKTDLLWAGEKLEEVEADMRKAFSSEVFESDNLSFDILTFIRQRQIAPRFEIAKVFGMKAPPQEIATAIDELLEMGQIIHKEMPTSDGTEICYSVAN